MNLMNVFMRFFLQPVMVHGRRPNKWHIPILIVFLVQAESVPDCMRPDLKLRSQLSL